MADLSYYNMLIAGIDNALSVERITHGISWTAATLSDGRCGVAMHTTGDSAERMFPTLEGMNAKEAANAVLSWNFEEASEGMAVINAFYNTSENSERLNAVGGTALSGIDLSGRTVCFVGHLPGHGDITQERIAEAKKCYILEREPRPGDLPDCADEFIIPRCDLVVITGSAAINKTLPRLLELSEKAEVVLTGPSTTLFPGIFDFGIDKIQGRVMIRKEEMLAAIVEKRRSVNEFSESFSLRKDGKK